MKIAMLTIQNPNQKTMDKTVISFFKVICYIWILCYFCFIATLNSFLSVY